MPLGHEHAGGQPEGGCRCDMAQKNARTEKYGSQTTGKEKKLYGAGFRIPGPRALGDALGWMWSWGNDEKGAKCLGHVPVWQ